jgi:hypothetical protein
MEKIEVGASYRLEDSFGAMVNFITPELRIGMLMTIYF